MFSLLLEEDGLSPNCYICSATYFSFACCSCPCPVSAKDSECERASHNGFSIISSSAAFLFCNLFECCYLHALGGEQKCLEPREKQHLGGTG